jgi:hypothetical protein
MRGIGFVLGRVVLGVVEDVKLKTWMGLVVKAEVMQTLH